MSNSEPLTSVNVHDKTTFSVYRKMALTSISDTKFPAGTRYQTPEGLRAEDEPTRAALDVQGGVYPIRESVFEASYVLDGIDLDSPASPSLLATAIKRTNTLDTLWHAILVATGSSDFVEGKAALLAALGEPAIKACACGGCQTRRSYP